MTSSSASSGALRAILLREWLMLVQAPIGWVALAAFAVPPGIVFALGALVPGTPVSMRVPLQVAAWCLFVTAPVFALRSISEERRSGTWDTLLSSPASATAIILGKFVALMAFLLLFALPLVAQVGLLSLVARPDLGEFACGLLGILLAGGAVLASACLFALLVPSGLTAYLLTIGGWSAWLLLGRALPTMVPPEALSIAFAVDPLRRVDDFLLGILDPANVLFFVAVIAWFLVASIDGVGESMRGGQARRRVAARAAMLSGALVLVIAIIGLASEPMLRQSVDLTRTRAWTLSDRTRALVASLDGDWRIEAIAGRDTVDAAALRQLDEVLARFDGLATRSGRLASARIDPADPSQSMGFEQALERLERLHQSPLSEAHAAVDGGIAAYERLASWAGAEANALTALLAQVPSAAEVAAAGGAAGRTTLTDEQRGVLEQWRAICIRVATDHRAFLDAVRADARSSEQAPLADPMRAASRLDAALRAWITQCNDAEAALRELRRGANLPPPVMDYLRDAPSRALDMAQRLASAQDRLARLPGVALSEVAAALRSGDAVVVSGPGGVAAIPGWQVLPPLGSGGASFDRRFRGEEVIAAALRSIERGRAPEVIFVHAEGRSLLRPSADRMDLTALADALRSVRCAVSEWQPGAEPRPLAREGRRQAWVIIPPLRRQSIEADAREQRLLEATLRLIESGEPILLAVTPSVLPLIGRPDPWAELAQRLGVRADSSRTVLELAALSEREREVRAFHEIDGASSHPAARGAAGMRTIISEPVPVSGMEGVEAIGLLEIAPAGNRWLEDDWRGAARRTTAVPVAKRFDSPVAVIVARERPGGARAVVSGGAGWLFSGLTDLTGQLGPERVFLRYPGNRELFVGIIGWLVELEGDFASATGREVERIPVEATRVRGVLGLSAVAGVPGAAMLFAAFLWLRRRAS
ncbi:MAG: hypothetical protein KF724_03675 [Phycisphaeraceae bacterium]|nr:hypothetical protein [Phycisphaeraceae bacterium]